MHTAYVSAERDLRHTPFFFEKTRDRRESAVFFFDCRSFRAFCGGLPGTSGLRRPARRVARSVGFPGDVFIPQAGDPLQTRGHFLSEWHGPDFSGRGACSGRNFLCPRLRRRGSRVSPLPAGRPGRRDGRKSRGECSLASGRRTRRRSAGPVTTFPVFFGGGALLGAISQILVVFFSLCGVWRRFHGGGPSCPVQNIPRRRCV